ncbi:MAG: acylphosphatase [Acidimicrobiales bacterium]
MDDVVRVRVLVWGRVQGVWYRASAQREARRLGVAGSAVNREDGGVELVLEGRRAAVDELLGWTAVGPPNAVVSAVDITDEEPRGLRGFSTRP